MTGENEQRPTISGSALRTLGALERTLRHHLAALENLECEDLEAAEAIVFAMEAAEKAFTNTRAVRRGFFRDV